MPCNIRVFLAKQRFDPLMVGSLRALLSPYQRLVIVKKVQQPKMDHIHKCSQGIRPHANRNRSPTSTSHFVFLLKSFEI